MRSGAGGCLDTEGKKMKEEVGARGRMSDRRRGSREGNGCARCPPNPFVTQRLIRVCEWASGYK